MRSDVPKILLVEDSDADALLIAHAFRKARVANEIIHVSSVSDAIEFFEATPEKPLPLFVLLDLKLPDLPGIEFLRWLRRHERLREIPVVVVTGSELPSDERAVEAVGANAFYRKHLSFERLVGLVQSTGALWALHSQPAVDSVAAARPPSASLL